MISPLIPTIAQMLCWSALMIISAIYLHAIDPLPAGASGFRKLWKGIGVIALLIGVALLVGGLSGGRDLLQPLSSLRVRAGAEEVQTPFVRIASMMELDQALARAGRPVMLDFYADWCASCKEMERLTFRDEKVRKRLGAILLLQVDVTANSAEDAAILKRFGLFGPPGIIFFDRKGKEIEGSRVIGYRSVERFLPILTEVAYPHREPK
jgi:thiol:disulfide interchange protein DsbD